jgi:hypothetical protein
MKQKRFGPLKRKRKREQKEAEEEVKTTSAILNVTKRP